MPWELCLHLDSTQCVFAEMLPRRTVRQEASPWLMGGGTKQEARWAYVPLLVAKRGKGENKHGVLGMARVSITETKFPKGQPMLTSPPFLLREPRVRTRKIVRLLRLGFEKPSNKGKNRGRKIKKNPPILFLENISLIYNVSSFYLTEQR